MALYYVLRNDAQTDMTCVAADVVTDEDRVAYDGSKKRVVHTIQARSDEIAFALFDAWQEREEQDRVHSRGCDEGECWCCR